MCTVAPAMTQRSAEELRRYFIKRQLLSLAVVGTHTIALLRSIHPTAIAAGLGSISLLIRTTPP